MLPRDTEREPIVARHSLMLLLRGEAIKGVRNRGIFRDDIHSRGRILPHTRMGEHRNRARKIIYAFQRHIHTQLF